MLFGHRMMDSDKMFVLHQLDGQHVVIICFFRFLGRQCDTAAANHRASHRMDHVAADGTDIKFAAKHIAGNILVSDMFAIHQFNDRNPQRLCQRLQQRNVR